MRVLARRIRDDWLYRGRLTLNGGAVATATGRTIYVDPADWRGRVLARKRGASDVDAVAAWRKLVDLIEPTLVIDVGANYGEVIFSTDYPDGAELHAVEANPRLMPYLRRTAEQWQASVHHGAASDSTGELTLHIGGRSSGISSVVRSHEGHIAHETVPAFRLDERIVASGGKVAIKVDVEGHEVEVLAGMSGILADSDEAMVLCEHSPGSEDYILSHFDVFLVELGTWDFIPANRDALECKDRRLFSQDLILRPR